MVESKNYKLLLSKAREDLTALNGMLDPNFSDSIFGFHAQQAVEKSLKAWIDFLGVEYPPIHDLRGLLRILKEAEINVDGYLALIDLNIYAVQLRYVTSEEPDPLNRPRIIKQVQNLLEKVELLGQGRD